MLDYIVEGCRFGKTNQFKPDFTDFTDFVSCFNVMQLATCKEPGAYVSINYLLLDPDPFEDRSIKIRYGFTGKDGYLVASIIDEDGETLNPGYLFQISRDTMKIKIVPFTEMEDEDIDEALKITLEYGAYLVAGIQWGAFFVHERAEERLEQHFDLNQEIH